MKSAKTEVRAEALRGPGTGEEVQRLSQVSRNQLKEWQIMLGKKSLPQSCLSLGSWDLTTLIVTYTLVTPTNKRPSPQPMVPDW